MLPPPSDGPKRPLPRARGLKPADEAKEALQALQALERRPWASVDTEAFGTLLSRSLDPAERHALGAHFTPNAHVALLTRWAVEEPLRAELSAARARATQLWKAGEAAAAREKAAAALRAICSTTILDPACGTGNFLVGALDVLLRLEAEARSLLDELGGVELERELAVTPGQLLGIEVNERAKEIAEVVLAIAYKQRKCRADEAANGRRRSAENAPPGLSVERRDAILTWEAGEPRAAGWPKADFIVGNPPFLGASKMRSALGDAYVEALRRAYPDVPDGSDLVMYWWSRSAALVRRGSARGFGLITTNSITQARSRRVVEAHLSSGELALSFAAPDYPWVDEYDGAAVRVAMTVGVKPSSLPGRSEGTRVLIVEGPAGHRAGERRLVAERGIIQADLSVGITPLAAPPLLANEGLASPGVKLHGAGFIVTAAEAEELGLSRIPGLDRHIRPYRNGRDLSGSPRGAFVIDLDGLSEAEVKARYPAVYARLLARVKPARAANSEAYRREKWWLFGRRNTDLRRALAGLKRYIATPETSKHRFFLFVDASVLPDNMVVGIGLDDAFYLGVLSSRAHVVWALAAGGRLGVGNDPRYTKTRCFDPFPFPICEGVSRRRIQELGEALDEARKKALGVNPRRTMTALYNAMAELRRQGRLAAKSAAHFDLDTVWRLHETHDALDAAVLEAYGLSFGVEDHRLLEALMHHNTEQAAEESRGVVRWLRPDLQSTSPSIQRGSSLAGAARAATALAGNPCSHRHTTRK